MLERAQHGKRWLVESHHYCRHLTVWWTMGVVSIRRSQQSSTQSRWSSSLHYSSDSRQRVQDDWMSLPSSDVRREHGQLKKPSDWQWQWQWQSLDDLRPVSVVSKALRFWRCCPERICCQRVTPASASWSSCRRRQPNRSWALLCCPEETQSCQQQTSTASASAMIMTSGSFQIASS